MMFGNFRCNVVQGVKLKMIKNEDVFLGEKKKKEKDGIQERKVR